MSAAPLSINATEQLAERLFRDDYRQVLCRTDRLFAGLLLFEWLAGIAAALWLSPLTWTGATSQVHVHVWAAALLGGLIAILPIIFVITKPGWGLTRHVVAVGQMLTSALWIHLLGGRIETHFHVFGSLAFLSFYRDWRVLATATIVVAADHFVRGWVWPESVYGISSGGEWRWLEHAGWVIFEDAFLILACFQGIGEMRMTARRQAEIEIKNRELAETTKRAEAAAKAKSQFLANMSHEIRTPLNGVIGMTDLLRHTRLDQRQEQYAGIIQTSADTLLNLINDVLDFSKIEAGKFELDRVEFDLGVIVDEVGEMLASRAAEKSLELICSISPEVHTAAIGDPARLRQVLVNLTANAIKFTDAGEVAVRVEIDPQQPVQSGRQQVRFTVTDTGIGIPPEKIDRLFKLFSQVDASMTRRHGGTGLGLAISKQLVELMGGQIGVTSAPGRGSTFWFSLPLEKQPTDRKPPLDSSKMRGLRVLVVDDNATNRQIFLEQCAAWGFHVEAVADGHEALERIRRAVDAGTPFQLGILDLQMPSMTGEELARRIKADPRIAAMPLMLLSSIDFTEDGGGLRAMGFEMRLVKPVRQSQLFDGIARILAASQPRPRTAAEPVRLAAALPASSAAQRKGVRILLAEDNRVNQIVATEMLRAAGYACELATDGVQAVEAVKRGGVSAILMDCQMPHMDGFEATQAIRKLEQRGPAGPGCPAHLPIIALTANAIKGDRERCLAAGMDEYVSKPIDPADLIHKLDHIVLPAPSTSPGITTMTSSSSSSSSSPIDSESLLRRCMGNTETVIAVLKAAETEFAEKLGVIESSLTARNARELAAAAHSLKGAAGMASAGAVQQVAMRLQTLGDSGCLDHAAESVAELRREVQRAIERTQQLGVEFARSAA
jgi:signal transduction histidine kinase/CheY-like chemotaxis protein